MKRTYAPTIADPALPARLEAAATFLLRWGLVTLVFWYGLFKFTEAEAQAIKPLLDHSPLFSWLYMMVGVRGAANIIGAVELLIAGLIALRPVAPRASAAGSLAAAGMFAMTLSFLATTPGVFRRVEWMVVPAGGGGFIIKDLLLLGAALWTAAESLRAHPLRRSS
jgi:reactive chlorine resistance protein C